MSHLVLQHYLICSEKHIGLSYKSPCTQHYLIGSEKHIGLSYESPYTQHYLIGNETSMWIVLWIHLY